MKLSQVNECLDHAITGGGEYGWKCWGNARSLDYETDTSHVSVVYNPKNQEIFEATVEIRDEASRPYRWLNPSQRDKMIEESKTRGIDPDEAWDDVKWIDLETEEDFLEKAHAIANGEDFDERIQVPLTLEDDEMLQLCMMAHEQEITLNQLVVNILTAAIADLSDK